MASSPFLSSHVEGEDELRDLSPEDAQELRAFQDRRWFFEGKLKLLEGLEPTYPFILPTLVPSTSDPAGYTHAGEEASAYSLPSAETLRIWQAERDALEEEVLAFDGGDLGRMKEKTREVTLVPLTKPSTRAVAITLDLILLIDRLLTLLRRRSDLLELVGLRLQWDGLRWKVMLECEKLKGDIRTYVDGEGRWRLPRTTVPVEDADPATPVKATLVESTTAPLPKRPPTNIQPISYKPLKTGEVASPTSPSFLSAHTFGSPIPALHPQSFSARHRTLVSTHLKRSSAILDRMIDIAGPLKNLGGVSGPLPAVEDGKESSGGALPDELLDMQDDLESLVEDIKGRVGWCKQLEDQKDRSERHYAAISRSRVRAERVISQLKKSLSKPASSAQHKALAEMLREAESSLPAILDRSFPRPRHLDYPDVEQYTREIIENLTTARADAVERVEISQDGVGWYARLSAARAKLEEDDRRILSDLPGFSDTLAKLSSRPPHLSESSYAAGSSHQEQGVVAEEAWLLATPDRISDLETQLPDLTRQAQLSQMAIMRYKSAFQPPGSIRYLLGPVEFPDDLHDEAEKRAELALEQVRRAKEEIERAKGDLKILPLRRKVRDGTEDLLRRIEELRGRVRRGIDQAAWKGADRSNGHGDGVLSIEETREAVDVLQRVWKDLLSEKKELDRLRFSARAPSTGREGRSEEGETSDMDDSLMGLRELVDLLSRVEVQREAVDAIDKEAAAMLDRLEAVSASAAVHNGGADTAKEARKSNGTDDWASHVESGALEGLDQRIKDWSEGLAGRVPFVSKVAGNGDLAASPDAPTLTGLGVPATGGRGYTTDLFALDTAVRRHVNDLSARVTSALEQLRARPAHHDPSRSDPSGSTEASTGSALVNASEQVVSSTPGHTPTEDVFGSVDNRIRKISSSSTPTRRLRKTSSSATLSDRDVSIIGQLRSLRQRVKSLRLPDVVFPSSSSVNRTPSLHRIPDHNAVVSISATLDKVSSSVDGLRGRIGSEVEAGEERGDEAKEHKELVSDFNGAKAFLPRLEALAAFSARSKACDETFGRLMEVLDSPEDNPNPDVSEEERVSDGRAMLKAAEEAALAVETDRRVISELKRLRAVWADLSASIHPPSFSNGQDDDASSVASSKAQTVISFSPFNPHLPLRIGSSLSIRSSLSGTTNRSTSNPFPRLAMTTESYRNRTVSNGTPGTEMRKRVDSTASVKSGMSASVSSAATGPGGSLSRASMSKGAGTPTTSRTAPLGPAGGTPSRIPRLAKVKADTGDLARTRKSSLPGRIGISQRRDSDAARPRLSADKTYVSDPKSTLDQAVGKIVNKLKMSVPIVPVNIAGTDEWKDQSGRYWIGAHGRAKLCFCRILRSRTVMVRVGGGWMELSRFLMDHFADALWPTPIEESANGQFRPSTPSRRQSVIATGDDETGSVPAVSIRGGTPRTRVSDPAYTTSPDPTFCEPTPTAPTPSATGNADVSSSSPMTPVRKSRVPRSSSNTFSASRPRSSLPLSRSSSFFSPMQSPLTPGHTGGGEPGSGPSSPLVPLHFLKKASESPPVREREKERLGAGRRSILGKEG